MALQVTFDLQEQRIICDKYTVLNAIKPIPPLHINCRCIPLTPRAKDLCHDLSK